MKVIIVGAGPCGLLLALLLAQHGGIEVQLLEAASELDSQPRAAHYGAAALPDLDKAGVLAEIKKRGIILSQIALRYFDADGPDGFSHLATFNMRPAQDVDGFDYRTHCLVLQDLDALMLELFAQRHGGTVCWRHRVVEVGNASDGRSAWVDVDTPDGRLRLDADYVVGCDGAGSQVRHSLFPGPAEKTFPGFTWSDTQIVATNTYYDFDHWNWGDVSMVLHPEDFFMAAKIDANGLYRVTYGERAGLSAEELRERLPAKWERILPGHPKPGDYKIINFSPYKMHQRCAPSFRVGRVLLAGDAAHVCNPWGGLGITGGFVDAGGLAVCLAGVFDGLRDDSILDIYSEKRIDKWRSIIDPISQANFRRVGYTAEPGKLLETDEFVQMLKKAETDGELARRLALGSLDIRYDFTQHFGKKEKEKSANGVANGHANGAAHGIANGSANGAANINGNGHV